MATKGRSNLFFYPLLLLAKINSDIVEGSILWELLPYMFAELNCDFI